MSLLLIGRWCGTGFAGTATITLVVSVGFGALGEYSAPNSSSSSSSWESSVSSESSLPVKRKR